MRLIAGVPLVTTPVRLGSAVGPVLAGHPATRLAGWAIMDAATGLVAWHGASSGAQLSALPPETLLVVPGVELVQRLGATLPQALLHAEDLCRLWGEPAWHATPQAIYASAASEPARQRVRALCRDLQHRLDQVADLLTPTEWSAYQCHRAINDRGIAIDVGTVRWLSQVIVQREAMRTSAVGSMFGDSAMTVTEALRPGGPLERLLARDGLVLANRSEDAVLDLLASGRCPPSIAQVLNALIGHGRIAKVKVDRIREHVDRLGRLRQQFVMWAARTWRFSSHGTQVQNLPRPAAGTDYAALAGLILDHPVQGDGRVSSIVLDRLAGWMPDGRIDDAFPALLRMCFTASEGNDLIVLDWNAIEPRIRAWLSDDEEHLEAWRQGRDLYSEFISCLVGRTITKSTDPHLRQVGKVADIGCGYHMGAESFADLCAANAVQLDRVGLTAERVVRQYRATYWRLSDPRRGLWARLQAGAIAAVGTGRAVVGRIGFERTADGHLDMILPNDSRRRWWKAEVHMRPPPWAKDGDRSQDRPVVVVAATLDGVVDQVMYGGRILENACQAIGREILVEFLIELERRGVRVVAHCHDEVVAEVATAAAPAILRLVQDLAAMTPNWAQGLPLRVEAFISPIWSKESPLG